jgi:hypothetical protein
MKLFYLSLITLDHLSSFDLPTIRIHPQPHKALSLNNDSLHYFKIHNDIVPLDIGLKCP